MMKSNSPKIEIKEIDLGNFFDAVDVDFNKIIEEKNSKLEENTKGPNILYLTTACNLDCVYCYEKVERDNLDKQVTMTKEEIDNALKLVYQKWCSNPQYPETVVIFGGEPLLYPDLVEYILNKSSEINSEAFAFCLTTNGIWFLKEENIINFKKWIANRRISLEISWDGSGNYLRVYKNKQKAEKDINMALDNLNKHKVDITLRYTIHSGNYDKVPQDLIYALEKWNNIKKIQTSYDGKGLDKIEPGINWYQLIYHKFKYQEYFSAIWNKYNVPLCQEVCNSCRKCDKSLDAINYFVPDKENVLVKKSNKLGQVQNKPFDHFLNK